MLPSNPQHAAPQPKTLRPSEVFNIPKDAKALSELEQKHTPVITAPKKVKKDETFTVTVEVGKLKAHPNEPAHFIEWIELYSGDTFLTRVNVSINNNRNYSLVP